MPMLGNNRAVINGTTGAVEQTIAYYPFGGVIADLGNPAGGQLYKFDYYLLSLYMYFGNDPVNAIDPTGKDIWTLDSESRLIDSQSFDMFDLILVYDKNNILKGSWKGDYGSIKNQSSRESKTGTKEHKYIQYDQFSTMFDFYDSINKKRNH